jgi:hypothetical protein
MRKKEVRERGGGRGVGEKVAAAPYQQRPSRKGATAIVLVVAPLP